MMADTQPLFRSAVRVCGVCTRQYARYKCPRCALQYCSLGCYRDHGERCVEGFYEEQVKGELQSISATDAEKQEMAKALTRLEDKHPADPDSVHQADASVLARPGDDANDSDSQDTEDEGEDVLRPTELAAMLEQGMSLEDVLDRANITEADLSAAGLSEFQRRLVDGSLSAQLQETPFWWQAMPRGAIVCTRRRVTGGTSERARSAEASAGVDANAEQKDAGAEHALVDGNKAVESTGDATKMDEAKAVQVQANEAKEATARSARAGPIQWAYVDAAAETAAKSAGAPLLPCSVPALEQLTRKEPPCALLFSLLEEVVSYAYVVRLYCGDPLADALQATSSLLLLSPSLSGELSGVHASAEAALLDFAQRVEHPAIATSAGFVAACLSDASSLLSDEAYVALVLSGLRELFSQALRGLPSEGHSSKARAATSSPVEVAASSLASGNAHCTPSAAQAPLAGSSAQESRTARRAAAAHNEEKAARHAKGASERARFVPAKRKIDFMQAWWLFLGSSGRRSASAELQFALRLEQERREEHRLASVHGNVQYREEAAAQVHVPRPTAPAQLIEEL